MNALLRNRKSLVLSLVGVVWLLAAACTDQAEHRERAPSDPPNSVSEAPVAQPEQESMSTAEALRQIPGFVDNANCLEEPTAPSLCDWMTAVDDVVFGEVASASVVTDNAVTVTTDEDEGVPSQQCDWIEPALEVQLEVAWSLRSEATGTITVTFGELQMDNWTTNIYLDANGDPKWSDPVAGLTPGTRVGMALYVDPTGSRWSPIGEHFFTTTTADTSGAVAYRPSETAHCLEPPPAGVGGETLVALKTAFAACGAPTSAATSRAVSRRSAWTDEPRTTHLATCHQDRAPSDECSTDSACEYDQHCVDGSCEPL